MRTTTEVARVGKSRLYHRLSEGARSLHNYSRTACPGAHPIRGTMLVHLGDIKGQCCVRCWPYAVRVGPEWEPTPVDDAEEDVPVDPYLRRLEAENRDLRVELMELKQDLETLAHDFDKVSKDRDGLEVYSKNLEETLKERSPPVTPRLPYYPWLRPPRLPYYPRLTWEIT